MHFDYLNGCAGRVARRGRGGAGVRVCREREGVVAVPVFVFVGGVPVLVFVGGLGDGNEQGEVPALRSNGVRRSRVRVQQQPSQMDTTSGQKKRDNPLKQKGHTHF